MANYRVNKNRLSNPNGDNEVHKNDCYHYNRMNDFEELGFHSTCSSAVEAAKLKGYRADGCKTCIPICHKR